MRWFLQAGFLCMHGPGFSDCRPPEKHPRVAAAAVARRSIHRRFIDLFCVLTANYSGLPIAFAKNVLYFFCIHLSANILQALLAYPLRAIVAAGMSTPERNTLGERKNYLRMRLLWLRNTALAGLLPGLRRVEHL